MDYHHRPRLPGQSLFYEPVVNLKGVGRRLHQSGLQSVLADGQDGCDERVGGNDDFVAIPQPSQLLVGTEHEPKGVVAVAAGHAVARADVVGVAGLEVLGGLTLQVPSAPDHSVYSRLYLLSMEGRDFLQ